MNRPIAGRVPDAGAGVRRFVMVLAVVLVLAAVGARAAPPDSPGVVETGLFGLEARGRRFVYVFDRSASMGEPEGRPLTTAKAELLRSLDRLGDAQQFHVIFYNHRQHLFAPVGLQGRPVFATEENRREARRFIEAVRADGGTRHGEPLATAFRLRPDVVFLLTDADAEDDLTPDELERLERLAGGARVMLVRFCSAAAAAQSPRLEALCSRTGGECLEIDPLAMGSGGD
jgi:hypothetical protein